jgi:Bacteroidetes-specific putative membrane protein
MRKYVLLLIVIFVGYNSYSQENPLITQQWFSRINHNPASVGSDDSWDIFMAQRIQWAGFKNAPKTTLLNLHSSVGYGSGVGFSAAYDAEGPARTSIIAKLLYSYRINITRESQLSLGLGFDVQNRGVNFNKLTVVDPADILLGIDKLNKWSIGVDFGLEFSTEQFTLGASVTNLGRKKDKLTTFTNGTQYYGYAHYKFPVADDYSLSPTGTYVYGNMEHLVELGLTGFFKEDVWLGLVYRIDNAICFMGGFRFDMFRIGYSYDYHTNDARKFGATHEVILSIRIPKPQRGLISNRDGSYRAPANRVYRCR